MRLTRQGARSASPRALHSRGRFLSIALLSAAACAATPPRPAIVEVPIDAPVPDEAPLTPPAPPALYLRLGGSKGVAIIIDTFADNLLADKRLRRSFGRMKSGPRLERFKKALADQVCEMTGGECRYTGKIMVEAHASMNITSAQFDAFVEDFRLALEEKDVTKEDAEQVLEQLSLLKDQIAIRK